MGTKRTSNLVFGLAQGEEEFIKGVVEVKGEPPSLRKSILNILNGPNQSIERLAFEENPRDSSTNARLWQPKLRAVPDEILKRIAIQDSLVSNIVRARQNHVSQFGRPRPDRFSTGFVIKPHTGIVDKLDEKGKDDLNARIERAVKLLATCGHTDGLTDDHQATFAEYLSLSARSAVVVGRIATEVVWVDDPDSPGKKKFHHFVATDAGTIYRATNDVTGLRALRREAYHSLVQLTGKDLEPERKEPDDFAWVQVIEGKEETAFTSDEMKCYNFYAVPDVEMKGYPVTPIDTVLSAVTTHINITTHNRLYFQSGRASRGMLVIKSDDAGPQVVSQIKQQFNASINSVSNSWRMPVFGCGTDEEITWQPIDAGGGKDMEFQYLTDMNAREILTAFMMSPDELPGWSYLSRGTNNQALSECVASTARILVRGRGLVEIGEFVGSEASRNAEIWSGKDWVQGRAFKSGQKPLVATELSCGTKLETSPDHRFMVVGADGLPAWKRQEDLQLGDSVLVNRQPVLGDDSAVPAFNGRKLTPEVAEVLGWLTGDGTLSPPRPGQAGSALTFFYHHEKDREVWGRHAAILRGWGVEVHQKEIVVSPEEQQALKERYGFKSIAPIRLQTVVYSSDFYAWLEQLGFSGHKDGKTVPALFSVLPVEYRAAFLRGLFSADGHATKQGAVVLTCQDDRTRDQVRQLLLGLGIRTLPCKGIVRESFGEKTLSKKLFVKDRAEFWERIGFLQSHKKVRQKKELWSNDRPADGLISAVATACRNAPGFKQLSKPKRDLFMAAASGGSITYQKLREFAAACGYKNEILDNYHVERVTNKEDLGRDVEMFDVEMFDDVHAFVVDGVLTHNSNNEYKLQAARDVGIRPLLSGFEDFVNGHLLPLIDPELAKMAQVKLVGLEADNPEKEAVRTQQDMGIWMTYDDVLERVEKKPLGAALGGTIPLNPAIQAVWDKYLTVGQILEKFFGVQGAAQDQSLAYRRDPFWFQWVQLQQQAQMAQQQAQAAQQGGGGPPPGDGGGGGDGQPPQGGDDGGGDGKGAHAMGDAKTENQKTEQVQEASAAGQANDLARSIDAAFQFLTKGEAQLPAAKRRVLAQHEKTVDHFMKGFLDDMKDATAEILQVARHHAPKPRA